MKQESLVFVQTLRGVFHPDYRCSITAAVVLSMPLSKGIKALCGWGMPWIMGHQCVKIGGGVGANESDWPVDCSPSMKIHPRPHCC